MKQAKRMMRKAEILRWRARWEEAAIAAAGDRNRLTWSLRCQWIWALEFILNYDGPHPEDRIPFPGCGEEEK